MNAMDLRNSTASVNMKGTGKQAAQPQQVEPAKEGRQRKSGRTKHAAGAQDKIASPEPAAAPPTKRPNTKGGKAAAQALLAAAVQPAGDGPAGLALRNTTDGDEDFQQMPVPFGAQPPEIPVGTQADQGPIPAETFVVLETQLEQLQEEEEEDGAAAALLAVTPAAAGARRSPVNGQQISPEAARTPEVMYMELAIYSMKKLSVEQLSEIQMVASLVSMGRLTLPLA